MVGYIIFPSSYYDVNKVDEDMRDEYDAVIALKLFDVILFSYEKWFCEGKIVLNREVPDKITAIYRGWMMLVEQYREFYAVLAQNNISLVTSPEQYEKFHIFPNIYPELKDDTARIMTFPKGEPVDLQKIRQSFKRFMVKDYVKSVKGTEFPEYFECDISAEEFEKWMQVFYKYRGDLYTGGICIKEYLDLVRDGDKTNEYRVFYANGYYLSLCEHGGQGYNMEKPPRELIDKYKGLASPYYSIDFAQLQSGEWKIIEAGDGSVSGLSREPDYGFCELYYMGLFFSFN